MWAHGIEPEQFGGRHSGFLQAVPAQRGKGGKRACTQDTEPRRTAGCRKGGENCGGCARGGRDDCNHCGGEAGEHANTRSGDQGRSDCARRGSEAGCRSVRACRMAQAPRAAAGTQPPATWRRAAGLHLERQASWRSALHDAQVRPGFGPALRGQAIEIDLPFTATKGRGGTDDQREKVVQTQGGGELDLALLAQPDPMAVAVSGQWHIASAEVL